MENKACDNGDALGAGAGKQPIDESSGEARGNKDRHVLAGRDRREIGRRRGDQNVPPDN